VNTAATSLTRRISIQTSGKGLRDITPLVADVVAQAGFDSGLCTVMVQHTSASLVIQENVDPSVQRDLQVWLDRLVPEDDTLYTHTIEGPDDMPAHIKGALTATTLTIPVFEGRLGLGRFQAIYLWEHRRRGLTRHCLVHVGP